MPPNMRIVTWNCCRGPVLKKLALLEPLQATLTIVQECPRLDADDGNTLWFGDNPRQGVAVIASAGYRLTAIEARAVPRYIVPIQIAGPISFLLLAVWSQQDPDFRYVKGIIRAVDCYRDLMVAQPTVVAGDFNSNTIWDHKRPNGQNHTGLVRNLAELGLVSAYHYYYDEAHGKESRPTLFLHRQEARPYHIDYCFIPVSWAISLRHVAVGTYGEWAAFSDHRPLVVDLDPPEAILRLPATPAPA
jgi:exodeoxyribonuclease III